MGTAAYHGAEVVDLAGRLTAGDFECWYRTSRDSAPRPTVLMFNGFDASQEEMLHVSGLAALQRGFHVVTFEGPGQPTVLREQGLGFRHDWEAVPASVIRFHRRRR
jgi:hypothetical protein